MNDHLRLNEYTIIVCKKIVFKNQKKYPFKNTHENYTLGKSLDESCNRPCLLDVLISLYSSKYI